METQRRSKRGSEKKRLKRTSGQTKTERDVQAHEERETRRGKKEEQASESGHERERMRPHSNATRTRETARHTELVKTFAGHRIS